ncbi:MAG: bifunctional riboflavin kinase/FAD synthetase [Acidimicrobiia bacterium]|nr:bifunctional riboflavin kinase/FAD synthetase [Acidimicrobiia bacterium]
MRVLRDPRACDVDHDTAVTIGFYDGVHRGHQQVIGNVREMAHDRGLASAVVTFDNHPAQIVRPESAPPLLTDLDQKLELLADTGVDYCLVVPFDHERSKETADEFVDEVIAGCLCARLVVVGEDFHFGHQRQGNVALLEQRGAELGFEVRGLGLVGLDGQRARDHEQVSSTAIRRALARGDIEMANRMLTRPYEVRGVVERGDSKGRDLGFPTANVAVDPIILLPADGVYAGWYERADGAAHAAAISVGTRPTFYDEHGALLLEAHVLDFDGDLYGEGAKVRFTHLLRGQERFDGVDALVAQMHADVAEARRLLSDR